MTAPQGNDFGNTAGGKKRRRHGWLRRSVNAVVLFVNVLFSAGLLFCAHCSSVAPTQWHPAVLLVMTFPAWLAATLLLFVLDLIWWRRTALVPGLSLLMCMSTVTSFCPLNYPKADLSPEDSARAFSLMTYNVYNFRDRKPELAGQNRQIDFILESDADIVCIQEALRFHRASVSHITDEQMERLHRKYPYFFIHGDDLAFLSKYPAESVPVDFPAENFRNGAIACWRMNIDGKVLNVFSVHLRSLYFTAHDKGVYEEVASLDSVSRSALGMFRADVLPKLFVAADEREEQVKLLSKYIDRYGGENVIVCGDFNDPVGCYPLYYLKKHNKMREVYAECGFGPTITYSAHKFFFRIDHILYKGAFKPHSIKRGDLDASDHYSLEAVFY